MTKSLKQDALEHGLARVTDIEELTGFSSRVMQLRLKRGRDKDLKQYKAVLLAAKHLNIKKLSEGE